MELNFVLKLFSLPSYKDTIPKQYLLIDFLRIRSSLIVFEACDEIRQDCLSSKIAIFG